MKYSLNDISIGDTITIDPHGTRDFHTGKVKEIDPDKNAVKVDVWKSIKGNNRVSGDLAMPICSIVDVNKKM